MIPQPNGANFTGGGIGGDLPIAAGSNGGENDGSVPADDTRPSKNGANLVSEPVLGSGLLAFLVAAILSVI